MTDFACAMNVAMIQIVMKISTACACILVALLGSASPGIAQSSAVAATFADATATAGIDFEHRHGGTGERYMVETMGSGAALADLDGDGWLDIYFVQNGPTPGFVETEKLVDQYFRNRGDGSFDDATEHTGVSGDGYGLGAAAADYDNDGFIDLYVTNYGPNRLYRNNGDGTFSDVTVEAGVGDDLWGSSIAWADIDHDGLLDLYVANYVDFGWDNNKFCGDSSRGLSAYCHPDEYNALPDRLYLNVGDGTFEEIGERAGIVDILDGKGLGVVFADYDDDGDDDAYIANDSTRNLLYTNNGDRTFTEDGFLAGVGYNEDGRTEAGMGVDWGDYDGDRRLDVVVTNLTLETNTLYRNLGEGSFVDASFATGLGEPSLLFVAFGTNWMDYDNDTDLDLFVANGHIIDNIAEFGTKVEGSPLADRTYPQTNHLYRNDGQGRFEEVHSHSGEGMDLVKVSRGSAVGDVDNDGDLDIMISNSNQSADYLRNDGGNDAGNWIQLRLVGRRANRNAVGARVTIDESMVREVRAGSSYCSSSDTRLHVGIGAAGAAEVVVRWPGGETVLLGSLQAGHLYVVQEGHGVVAIR